jgi:hypothetical protein
MTKPKGEQIYDLRTLEQFLRSGKISQKDYDAYLKSLPDSESNADYIEVFEEPVSSTDPTQPEGTLTFRPAEPS